MKKIRKGHMPNQAFGQVAKKPQSKIPGTDRGEFSKMPAGPSVGKSAKGPAARAKRLKGVMI